ncbi:hypothetical protein ES703_71220 [subsurface metagenome]
MLWEEWLTAIAPVLALTVDQAGIILGLLFTFVFALLGGLITHRNVTISMGIPAFMGILIFTYAAWLPAYTGTAIALIVALLIAKEMS